MHPNQIIVLAIPFFLLLMALEIGVGLRRKRLTYRSNDTITSLSVGLLSQLSAVFTPVFRVGIYAAVFEHLRLWQAEAFWLSPWGWALALLFYDFCYYWQHRLGHTCALLWASHVVHHHGQDYNLATALRQTSTGALTHWVFYIPMALAGVPPLVFGVVALVNLLYQFWIHTEQIGSLGWFDRVFASPSNHRVHHAVNDAYVDKNYGGLLILWDRLFGTFAAEMAHERCVYSTRTPLNSWDPLWANAETFVALAQDSWHAQRWTDKLRVWFKPPGWRPADVAARDPKAPFALQEVRRFDTQVPSSTLALGVLIFTFWLGVAVAFLWTSHTLSMVESLGGVLCITLGLWSLSTLMQNRLRLPSVVMLQVAAGLLLLPAFMPTSAWAHYAVPAVTLAGLWVWQSTPTAQRLPRTQWRWLGLAVLGGFVGDVLLRFDSLFVPGLLAFLIGHVAYTVTLQQDAPRWPSRVVLALTLVVGMVVLAVLWHGGLPTGLRLPVAVYVLAITLMAAQAMGRALVLRTLAAWLVALGALFFMVSDTLLAYTRFIEPLPYQHWWVHLTYYAAQCLMLLGLLHRRAPPAGQDTSASAPAALAHPAQPGASA